MKGQDTYKEVKELRYGNAIICVYIPDLTKEERKRRESNLLTTMSIVGKEIVRHSC